MKSKKETIFKFILGLDTQNSAPVRAFRDRTLFEGATAVLRFPSAWAVWALRLMAGELSRGNGEGKCGESGEMLP